MDKFSKLLLGLTIVAIGGVFWNGLHGAKIKGVSKASDKLAVYLRVRPVVGQIKLATITTSTPSSKPTTSPNVISSLSPTPSPTAVPAKSSVTTPVAVNNGVVATDHVVKDGDTYGCIAEKYYGSYENYPDIMAANLLDEDGYGEYQLFVGNKLTLPAISAENIKPATELCK